MTTKSPPTSVAVGRVYVVLAAVLWSTSGALTKILTQPTFANLDQPPLASADVFGFHLPIQIACYRTLFAALAVSTLLRGSKITVRPAMFLVAGIFALMNLTFVSAMALGTSANAILLQYSAPLWLYLASVFWLKEPSDAQSTRSMFVGLIGIAIIVAGGWTEGSLLVVLIALTSGITFAGVLLGLRVLRDVDPTWLTVWNLAWGAIALSPLLLGLRPPTLPQFALLVGFGAFQLGLPYMLMAKGIRSISPQEAGTITLLEPLLNPLWAYLVSPETETPPASTFVGGAIILGALAWRYLPARFSLR